MPKYLRGWMKRRSTKKTRKSLRSRSKSTLSIILDALYSQKERETIAKSDRSSRSVQQILEKIKSLKNQTIAVTHADETCSKNSPVKQVAYITAWWTPKPKWNQRTQKTVEPQYIDKYMYVHEVTSRYFADPRKYPLNYPTVNKHDRCRKINPYIVYHRKQRKYEIIGNQEKPIRGDPKSCTSIMTYHEQISIDQRTKSKLINPTKYDGRYRSILMYNDIFGSFMCGGKGFINGKSGPIEYLSSCIQITPYTTTIVIPSLIEAVRPRGSAQNGATVFLAAGNVDRGARWLLQTLTYLNSV